MSLDRLVLVIVCVLAALWVLMWAVWVGVMTAAFPPAAFIVLPALLVAYILWRVIRGRVGNAEDDHYDGMMH